MSMTLEQLQDKDTGAFHDALGASPELASAVATVIIAGKKVASCGSLQSGQEQEALPQPGGYSIVLNGEKQPVCVIRTTGLFLTRFDRVTPEMAMLEGEGDLSLDHWRQEHKRYFECEGYFHKEMELIFETFQLVEVV